MIVEVFAPSEFQSASVGGQDQRWDTIVDREVREDELMVVTEGALNCMACSDTAAQVHAADGSIQEVAQRARISHDAQDVIRALHRSASSMMLVVEDHF